MPDNDAVSSPRSFYWSHMRSAALLFFGVALPLAALAVELMLGLNASEFFDPVPTFGHVLLVACVAAANAWAWFVTTWQKVAQVRWVALANGFATGIALVYTVLFLPLLPLGAIAIVFFGLGLLAWAPLASLLVAWRLRVRLRAVAATQNASVRAWPGVVAGLLALIALDTPSTITRIGAGMAMDESAETRLRGVRLLRAFGSEDQMLRMCYVRTGATTDLMSLFINRNRYVSPDMARQLYYRMTGRAFNSVPAPVNTRRSNRWDLFEWGDADFDQGADSVGGRVRDLWLASSKLDGSVSGDAALGYIEWTMVFKNDSQIPREARTQIALPPGGVVSRVTLWINGEEREAAFGGRGEVRAAYQAVVSARRDPVLVTTAGPDRISMHLFPVPPSGEMKVRLGITAPLGLTNAREGVLSLPYFHERNFDVRKDLRHGVWIESKSPLSSALASSSGGTFRAEIEDARLLSPDASIVAARREQNTAWTQDTRSEGHVIRQVIGSDVLLGRPRRVVLVVDGSTVMERAAAALAKSLRAMPADMDIRLVFAHDEFDRAAESRSRTGVDAAEEVASFDYDGGHDNTPALARGLDLAFEQPDSVLLWIHGPQPVLLETEEALRQRLWRGPKLANWYELQVAPGSNLVGEKLEGLASIETLRANDLERLISAWNSTLSRVTARRERIESSAVTMPADASTSDHLVRLWAKDEVTRLMRSENRKEAIEVAQKYQLVTPVSGAVVLETQQQYDAAGLQPVPEGSVPTIPEPEEWALMIVALIVLGYAYLRRRRTLVATA